MIWRWKASILSSLQRSDLDQVPLPPDGPYYEKAMIMRSMENTIYFAQAIKVEEASGLLATRYAPERYQEFRLE